MAASISTEQPLGVEDHTSHELRRDPYFPSAHLGDWGHSPLALRERAMLWLMNEITDMPQWQKLVGDNAVVADWHTHLPDLVLLQSSQASADAKSPPQGPPTLSTSRATDGEVPVSSLASAENTWVAHACEKARAGALPALPAELATTGFTPAMLDACVTELRAKADICRRQGHDKVRVLDADAAVFKLSLPLADEAKAALAALEAEAHDGGDYRPDHGYTVLPLAHSSVYPIVYGRTRAVDSPSITRDNCISSIGTGTTLPWSASDGWKSNGIVESQAGHLCSRRFAWLPTDVNVVNGKARLKGYINNVHPKHVAVYDLVEKLLEAALPCFSQAIDAVKRTRSLHREDDEERARDRDRRMPWARPNELFACQSQRKCRAQQVLRGVSRVVTKAKPPDAVCRVQPLMGRLAAIMEERSNHFNRSEIQYEKLKAKYYDFAARHPMVQPEPSVLLPQREYQFSPWSGGRLQVIVQINNHELTPENSTYAGGQWHIEGLLNEHIVGSAIFYYDVQNITESRLALAAARGPVPRDIDDKIVYRRCRSLSSLGLADRDLRDEARTKIYGEETQRTLSLGAVKAVPGRMVVFPNVLEHRVEPFELLDKTRSGQRKMVTLFLIDPALTIMSTSRVPPQQLHWADTSTLAGRVQDALPPELGLHVFGHVPCPYDTKTARKLRDELMEERGAVKTSPGYVMTGTGRGYTD